MYGITQLGTIPKITSGLKLPTAKVNNIMVDITGPAIVINGKTGTISFCNKHFEVNFGYSVAELQQPSVTFFDLLDDAQHERFQMQLEGVTELAHEREKYSVYKIKSKSGASRTVYLYATPIDDSAYPNFYCLTIFADSSNYELPFISFDTRDLFLELFNKESFGTFEWHLAHNKIFWSEGVYLLYEIDKSNTVIDYGFAAEFTHPEDKDRITAAMQEVMRTNGTIDIVYKIITANNNVKAIRLIGKIIADNNQQPEKFVGSVRDITEQISIEEDLKRNVEELNRSNKELEEFAYVASHDLQEPLRKISTFSDRLSEKYKDILEGEGTMYLERMIASADNMRMLINNLLEFSRVAKSTQPFTPTNFNFILHQVRSDLELIIEETGTVINSVTLPTITASMTQVKQLFSNIINNAIKFRKPSEKPIINIEVRELSEREKMKQNLIHAIKYYRFQITDNGIGFENEYAQKIFQIFQRLHGKAEYPGSGIGLAICKKIVERHHGIIYAESMPGQGARFVFILPENEPSA